MANSLMRLKCEGEQPLDRYIRFKNNPLAWTEEMTNYGLLLEEQQVLKDHLINNCGVCDTQEELMRLVMDKKIGGFTLTEANNFRKAIAKKSEKKQKEQKKLLFEKGVSLGNRKEFLEYVWDYEIRFSLGYAFSSPHVIGLKI